MNDAIYAIGDIHGHLDQFHRVHDLIAVDQAKHGHDGASIVHIGDLTDRGPDSKGVLDHLIDGRTAGQPWIIIKGNHDRLFHKFYDDPNWIDPRLRSDYTWLHTRMGGMTTLASYGVNATAERTPLDIWAEAREKIPAAHMDFLRDLPLTHAHDDLLFVHAGIRPGVAIADQVEDDLVWIREPFHSHQTSFGPMVVHGHTMVHQVEHYDNRLNIDTGAGRGDALSAVVIEGRQVWVLAAGKRQKLAVSGG